MVRKHDRVGFGIVQFRQRDWYLITSDESGMLGNEPHRGLNGCDCGVTASPRQFRGDDGVRRAVEYEIVGEMPPHYVGSPRRGLICDNCKRAMRAEAVTRWQQSI
jgi:hypothetical protein